MHYVAAILYGWAGTVLAAIALGFYHGALHSNSAAVSLCTGTVIAFIGWLTGRRSFERMLRPRGWEWFPVILFGLFTVRAFLWLIFRDGDELLVLSPNNLGDMSLHLTFINYLANGASFWPDSPIFAQGKLTYSLGTDLFNSLLVLVGVDIVRGLIWVGLIGGILSGCALWRWGRGFALLAFLCSGGLLGLAAFTAPNNEPFFQDYAGLLKFDWAWKSLPLALLVTQRGFLYALPAGLLLLASWRSRFLGDEGEQPQGWRLPFLGELLLYAAMPIFHMHTFIALSFVLACWWICRTAARWKILRLVGAAFIPATVLVYLTVGMFQSNAEPVWTNMSQVEDPPKRPATQVLGWEPGWMVNEPQERFDAWKLLAGDARELEPWEAHGRFLLFWLGNFGVLPFFVAAAGFVLLRRIGGTRVRLVWAVLALMLFVLITPFLGQWPRYQERSVSGWILGELDSSALAYVALAILSTACGGFAAYASWRQRFHPALRIVCAAFAGIFILDAGFAMAHSLTPQFPLLRANAIPLLLGTAAFLWLLIILAQHWRHELLPAALFFPGIYLFLLCCNVKFAPAAWDNTKLMLWAYLLIVPVLWEILIARWQLVARGAALLFLFFSGFVCLIGGLNRQYRGYPIARLSELDAVQEATRAIDINETFAAFPIYDHPLLLTGRKLVLGYSGHLWSHGILFDEQERHLHWLMQGGNTWRLDAARLGARYLFFGLREAEQWKAASPGWRDGAQLIWSSEWGELYDLETPPVPTPGETP